MIIKVISSTSSSNLLSYLVNQEHKVLDAKGVIPNASIEEVKKEFRDREVLNNRAKKIVYNIIVAFPIDEDLSESLENQLLQEVVDEFSEGNDLWYAVKHPNSSTHKHFHIALSAIHWKTTKALKMKKYAWRAILLSRKLEEKYRLKQVASAPKLNHNQRKEDLKFAILHALSSSKNLDSFVEHMTHSGYKTIVGRGVSFVEIESGVKFKGSDVGREYNLRNIEKALANEQSLDKPPTHIDNLLDIGSSILDTALDLFPDSSTEFIPNVEDGLPKKKKKKPKFRLR